MQRQTQLLGSYTALYQLFHLLKLLGFSVKEGTTMPTHECSPVGNMTGQRNPTQSKDSAIIVIMTLSHSWRIVCLTATHIPHWWMLNQEDSMEMDGQWVLPKNMLFPWNRKGREQLSEWVGVGQEDIQPPKQTVLTPPLRFCRLPIEVASRP